MRDYRGRVRACWEFPAGLLLQTEHPAGTMIEQHPHAQTYRSVVLFGQYTEHVHASAPRLALAGCGISHAAHEQHADYFHSDSLVLTLEPYNESSFGEIAAQAGDIVPYEALQALFGCAPQSGLGNSRPRWAHDLENDFDWFARRPLQRAAERANLHPAHLSRAFRAHFGETIGSYRERKRGELLASRLAESDEPLSAIAYEAGYADQSHMTANFMTHTGMTPQSFRRRFRSR